MIGVGELMSDPDFIESVTLRRPTPSMQEGVAVATHVDTTITAIVQPATPRELMGLPEGQRLKDVVSVWSATEMKAEPGAPDILLRSGRSYRVIKLEPWAEAGYYRAFAEGFEP